MFSTLEVVCFYWAVAYLPLADVMAFYLAGPIYVAGLAALLLGDITARRAEIPVDERDRHARGTITAARKRSVADLPASSRAITRP